MAPPALNITLPAALAIARAVFPDAPADALVWLLWHRTGYPCFWTCDPTTELRAQLEALRETERVQA